MKYIFSILTVILALNVKAQDKIIKSNGEEILAKVIEISLLEIKYKKFENLEGPTIVISKKEISKIMYENGTSDNFELENATLFLSTDTTKKVSTDHFRLLGDSDAKLYYKGKKSGNGGTIAASLLSPLIGLVPAVICSAIYPNEVNLNYPSEELMKNKDYRISYLKRAKKIKQKKIWLSWSTITVATIFLNIGINKNAF